MKTRRRFMEEDSMDVEEAAAVERRNFFIEQMFEPNPMPTREEEQ